METGPRAAPLSPAWRLCAGAPAYRRAPDPGRQRREDGEPSKLGARGAPSQPLPAPCARVPLSQIRVCPLRPRVAVPLSHFSFPDLMADTGWEVQHVWTRLGASIK